jgi:hypothetical protein
MNKSESEVCEQCLECECYWQNTDSENECEGAKEPCHEFIENRYKENI